MLAGCGGSQPPTDTVPQTFAIATRADRGKSWILSEAKSEDLLYVSDISTDTVLVYSYKTRAQLGQLTGFGEPYGQCVDASGDVWITDVADRVVDEYAHGGSTPLKQLSASLGEPVGCSVSPNGDLAVSSDSSLQALKHHALPFSTQSGVLVYKNASGSPVSYTNADCDDPASPGYDDKGNLYAEGEEFLSYSNVKGNVCELPAGGTALGVIPFLRRDGKKQVGPIGDGSIMWDGEYLMVTLALDQTRLVEAKELTNGSLQVVRGMRPLDSDCEWGNELRQVFVVGKKNTPVNRSRATVAVAGNELTLGSCYDDFNAFAYPAGGRQLWSLDVRYAFGESVSLVPR
jgi:hypothetical protein